MMMTAVNERGYPWGGGQGGDWEDAPGNFLG